jgi:hypothetical protein
VHLHTRILPRQAVSHKPRAGRLPPSIVCQVSAVGCRIPAYHGLLIAPLDPPLARALVFAKADTELVVGERRLRLSTSTVAVLLVLLVLEISVNGREQFGSA